MTCRLRYPAVLFDLDGTLIDSARDLVASVCHALRRVDPTREPPDSDTITMEIGKPLETILSDLGYPVDAASAERFVDTYRAYYAEHFNDHTNLYPGVQELLAGLKSAGVKLALVTAKHQSQAEFAVGASELGRYFDYVHGWLEGRKHKPDPEPLLVAASVLGFGPEHTLMVGDSEQDVLAARSARMAVCAAAYGFRPAMMLKTLRPDYLVSRPADVFHIVVALDEGRRSQKDAAC